MACRSPAAPAKPFGTAAAAASLRPRAVARRPVAPARVVVWPAVNGSGFLPAYGTLNAAISVDRSGKTRSGRFVLNHSFMLPGLVATIGSVGVGLLIARLF